MKYKIIKCAHGCVLYVARIEKLQKSCAAGARLLPEISGTWRFCIIYLFLSVFR